MYLTTAIKDVHHGKIQPGPLRIAGWVRTHRSSKNVCFIELGDGTTVKGLQLVIEPGLATYAALAPKIATGASIIVEGTLVPSPAKGQRFEMQVDNIELIGEADPESYPLQKKGHSLEFLREQMHLRPRSNTIGAVMRVRSRLSLAIHRFYEERGFYYVHTPILTTSDCEGAGEMFRVSTLSPEQMAKADANAPFRDDFFGEQVSLTVSGQLEGEVYATAIRNIYTFGPTFRAENSNTTRHLAEFWMIEPEMAFCDLAGNRELAQEFVQYLIKTVLTECSDELEFLHARDWSSPQVLQSLEAVVTAPFEVIDYTDAIKILEKSGRSFEYPVTWGIDLQTEHERFLTDEHIKGPVAVVNYPKDIKAFYMRLNDDDRTVAAMDILVPRLGEIIGGAQREERFDILQRRMVGCNINPEHYWWYLQLRTFGSVPHAGFGLGLERILMYVTGMQNIRDVIPFPRFPGFAKF
jgi:asparaginyl-tRNA synthetase